MSPDYGQLALWFARDCDRSQSRRIRLSYALCALQWCFVCWWLVLALLVGSLVGLGIIGSARSAAKVIRGRICRDGFFTALRQSTNTNQLVSDRAKFARQIFLLLQLNQAIGDSQYHKSRLVHLCLASKLLPIPTALRA